jgi:8-oxo-dGTP pyrophosphatase MutT (NUDIX family)
VKEVCSGGIVYFNEENKRLFLLIKSSKTGWWVFPKGHKMENESLKETSIREIKEETGMKNLGMNEEYHEIINFINNKGNEKEVHHFLFESFGKEVTLSNEHNDYKWLEFGDAYDLVDHKNQKKLLKIADNLLKNDQN